MCRTAFSCPEWVENGRCLLSRPVGVSARCDPDKPGIKRINGALSWLEEQEATTEILVMKTIASDLVRKAMTGSAFLIAACATTDPVQPSATTQETRSSAAVPGTAPQLPAMSADRCVAEAIGTATDPTTGAPVSATVDPQTGKPVCPPEQPNTTPPRQ